MGRKPKAGAVSGGVGISGGQVNAGGDIFGGNQVVYEAAAAAISALHQIRAPVADFVGREREIGTLVDALRAGGHAGLSGVQGMGGIGKSELARAVAQRLLREYPDAQLWVDLRGTDASPRPVTDALASCIRAFVGPEAKLPADLEELKGIYLSQLSGKRVLMVLDNAGDEAQVRPLLPPVGCAVLITSRETLALPGLKRVALDELPLGQARELLTGMVLRVSGEVAEEICKLCGCLPLALRAAGSLLDVTSDLDPADYAKELRDERTRLAKLGTAGVDVSVEASFGLSYARLNAEAARVFRRLAVFPGWFDAKAEEIVCEDAGHAHQSELLRRGMVLYDAAAARYRLHDLVRLFAGVRLEPGEREGAQKRHAEHYKTVAAAADRLYIEGGDRIVQGLRLFDLEWGNVQVGQAWAAAHAGEDDRAAELCSDYPDAAAYCIDLRLHPREQIRWLETALSAARRLKKRDKEAFHLGNLGIAYGNLGETRRAIEYFEQQVVVARETGDRRGEGNALGSLGIAYDDLGETRRAIEYSEQHLAIAREIGDRRGEGNAVGNLGVAYKNLGETRRAIEYYEQQLAITREIGDLRGEGNALWNSSLAFDKLGDRAEASARAQASFEIREAIKDPNAAIVREQLAAWTRE